MVYVSARALEEELRHLEEELAAARNLEHSTAERHAEEGSRETEAVLEARKNHAEHLEAEREGLLAELRRRAVAEAGWEHDDAGGAGPDGAVWAPCEATVWASQGLFRQFLDGVLRSSIRKSQ